MHTLLFLAFNTSAFAADVIYQGNVRGGVAVDASGVDVSALDDGTPGYGDDFEIVIPATAVITEAFVVLHAKPDGITSSPENVFINGWPLTLASLVSASETTEIYQLTTPSTFGITGTGYYTYSEAGSVEDEYHFGPGIHGASLVVVYEDFVLNGYRHVVIATDNVTDGDSILRDLATNTVESAVISYGLTNECARDQANTVVIETYGISTTAGGSDDGSSYSGTCGAQDWNSLLTQGSFGIDDFDTIVGVAGDIVDGVPADGDSLNSRLDDELYQVPYDRDGELTLGYSDLSGDDSQLSLIVAVIEIDSDADGVADSVDNCPDDANPDQIDSDGDGVGDVCAGCVDIDGDGYGLEGITEDCEFPDGVDCDDTDPLIHSGAAEIWYDGIDQNCDGADDFDQDGDSYISAAYGGDDCDDLCELTHPGAEEIWYNGEDNNCDGGCDFDQDGDSCPAAEWYLEAAADSACDLTCFDDLVVDEPGDTGIEDTGDTGEEIPPGGDTGEIEDSGDLGDTGDMGDATDTGDAADTDDAADTGDATDTDDADTGEGSDTGEASDTSDPTGGKSWADDSGLPTDDTGIDSDEPPVDDEDCYCDADTDCEPAGTEYFGGDCDDTNADRVPGNPEVWYDGVDQDCDGNDDDQDGDGEASDAVGGPDCDDNDPEINSEAEEVWYDDTDDNCDGNTHDQDEDGEAAIPTGSDCDDLDAAVNTSATEVWYDEVDDNCDGNTHDQDGDGEAIEPVGPDCDDLNERVYSTATEVWYDGVDQDCSGTSDFDQDEDGHERRPEGDDCDDLDPGINPSAEEIWEDDIDQDCDGITYKDTDGDGSPDYLDCDPEDDSIYPDAAGYKGCEEVAEKGLLGLGPGTFKGGGCSQAPLQRLNGMWVLGLMLLGLRRRQD